MKFNIKYITFFSILLYCSCLFGKDVTTDQDSFTLKAVGENKSNIKFEVVTDKLHMYYLSSEKFRGHFLIKEFQTRSMMPGIEGVEGSIDLEFWKIGLDGLEDKVWEVSEEADFWEFEKDSLYFIDKGCCDKNDVKIVYDLNSGEKLKIVELPKQPVRNRLLNRFYPEK